MGDKIRVLHVGLDSHLGGIETYLKKITTHIDKDKFQFDFLGYNGITPYYYDELRALGSNFYFITGRRHGIHKNHSDLKRLFENERFDIVHCHFNSLSYIAPCTKALKAGCKVIVHSRNAGCLSGKKDEILHKLNYYLLPKGKIKCAAVSDLAGEWMFGDSTLVTVLNNGLDTDKYRFDLKYRDEIRKEFGIGDEEVIINVGAFRTQKNHEFLIDIFNEYHKLNPAAKLILVGEGELKAGIIEKTESLGFSENVIFAGQRSDTNKLLSAADKFLFPSLYEGFPNALLEAQTAGLYCVAADTITAQAMLDGKCTALPLDAGAKAWAKQLSLPKLDDRKTCADDVETAGFGIRNELKRLSDIYIAMVNE